jgi:DNA-binding NtrC family response regulator
MSRALVVDDDPAFCLALAEALHLEGYATLAVSTCQEALAELARNSVDILFVDVNLPDGSGLDLLPFAGSPAVVVTGEPSLALADEALRRGARDCLAKPVDRLRVRMTLASIAREGSLREEIARLREEAGPRRSEGRLP